jgi:glycosidase
MKHQLAATALLILATLVIVAGAMASWSVFSPPHVSAGVAPVAKGLLHDTRNPFYRAPFGAVPTGSHIRLRFRTAHSAATTVVLFLRPVGVPLAQAKHIRMHRFRETARYDYWEARLVVPTTPQQLAYRFRIARAGTTVWYGDDALQNGGRGEAYRNAHTAFDFTITVYSRHFRAPSWVRDAVIYEIFPDRFSNGDPSNDPKPSDPSVYGNPVIVHHNWSELPVQPACNCDFFGGDLQGIINKLGYLNRLGINTVYLTPIFEARSNHKYDTADYLTIDPHFGTLQTFQMLIARAHALGIHVILDGVFNHTGSDSVYFNKYGRFPSVGAYQSQSSPYYSWYTFYHWPDQYKDWMGYDSLPVLNENGPVEAFIFRQQNSVAQYWLEQGAAGWRLDSADQKSHAWWQAFRQSVKARYPDAVLIGEYWQDALPWLLGDQWDGVMNYRFRDAVLGFFAHGRGTNYPAGLRASVFNDMLMGILEEYPRPAIYSSMNLVDSHDTERILYDLAGNKRALRLVALFQMTWLGAPTVYYGDEAGLTGGTDPDDRRTFPWGHEDTALQRWYQTIIHLRLHYVALRRGMVIPLLVNDSHRLYAFMRRAGNQRIIVALNDDANTHTVRIKVPGLKSGTVRDVLNSNATFRIIAGTVRVALSPISGRILLVQG